MRDLVFTRLLGRYHVSDPGQHVGDALVLAAGNGTRLQSGTPKPAHPLLGVPLLARTLLSLERAGITDAYVVLGYEAERVRAAIEKVSRIRLRIHWLYNPEWRRPNGVSVLAAAEHLHRPFILTMADHLFDPGIVTALRRKGPVAEGIDLAVDSHIDRVFDLDDATKVRVENGRIADIGKSLTAYDAIDTGVFLATPAVFTALREAMVDGSVSLSDGVRRLAEQGAAHVTDIGDRMWQDIDTPEAFAEGERKLLAGVRKATDGPIARTINRPLSVALSRRLVRTPVTPNQLSVINLAIGLGAAACAALGNYGGFLVGGILFQLASILDGVDGEVAKLTFQSSPRGEWIDTACDQVSYVAFLLGLAIGVYRADLPPIYFQVGLLGVISGILSLASISLFLTRQKGSGSALSIRYSYQEGTGLGSRVMRVVQYLGKRDMLAFLVFVLAVVGQLPLGFLVFGLGATFLLLPVTVMPHFALARRRELPVQTAPLPVAQAQHDPA